MVVARRKIRPATSGCVVVCGGSPSAHVYADMLQRHHGERNHQPRTYHTAIDGQPAGGKADERADADKRLQELPTPAPLTPSNRLMIGPRYATIVNAAAKPRTVRPNTRKMALFRSSVAKAARGPGSGLICGTAAAISSTESPHTTAE